MSPGSPIERRTAALGIAAAGLLIALGGVMHPRVDTGLTFDEGLAGMFESALWTASHGLAMAGYVVFAVALALFLRARDGSTPAGLRVIGWSAVAAAALAAVESVPHMLAASEAGALRRGGATPLTDLHKVVQALSTPAFGLSVVALAVAGARTGVLDGGRVATALAVLGGLALALAGPAIALTEDSSLSPLFAGAAGLALWAMVAGIRTARRPGRAPDAVQGAGRVPGPAQQEPAR
jgi:hypothetical protein